MRVDIAYHERETRDLDRLVAEQAALPRVAMFVAEGPPIRRGLRSDSR
jgi:hypothetical protein